MDNKKYFDLFQDEADKASAFDILAELYFNGNFGTLNKSQLDVVMFHIYCQACRDKNVRVTDYGISKELGIVQSTVRSLRKKEALKFPDEMPRWEEEFLKSATTIQIKNNDTLIISIEDPYVQTEIQHYIEEKGSVVDKHLESKLLSISPYAYLDMLVDMQKRLDGNDTIDYKQQIIDKLKSQHKDNEEIFEDITKENLATKLKGNWPILFRTFVELVLPGGSTVARAIDGLLTICENWK